MPRDRKSVEAIMEQGFVPDLNADVDRRAAIALEYIAFALTRMDRNLKELLDLMRKQRAE